MSQIRKYAVIYLLICISLVGCSNAYVTPIAREYQEKFGMQIPSDLWQIDEAQDGAYQHGLLTHRSIKDCRVRILSSDPGFINGYISDEAASTFEEFKTTETRIDLIKLKDKDGSLRYTFFEVFDTTAHPGGYRLAYFLVEAEKNPAQCVEAVQTLLLTLKPGLFKLIGTAQG